MKLSRFAVCRYRANAKFHNTNLNGKSYLPYIEFMLRGDDVENIYLIENHHEALGYWRNMHISNKTIIHIDSHHDLFEGPSFPWINNYLWFAIKENILKEIYLVYPKHIIKNFDLVEKYVASIMGFVSLTKISHHMFSVTTTLAN